MAMTAETKARRKEAREYEARMRALQPIADKVTVITRELVEVEVNGAMVNGNVTAVNVILEKCGFRPVRITSNMLNKDSKPFAIDINTPSYCDPGCESYHSM